jgi:hypothetical protein
MLCMPSVEASLPPMSPVRSSTGTMTHSIIVGEVPIGMASGRPGINTTGGSLPTTPHRISFSPYPLVPRSPSSPTSWGFAPSSPTAVQGGRHSPLASSHSERQARATRSTGVPRGATGTACPSSRRAPRVRSHTRRTRRRGVESSRIQFIHEVTVG